MITTANTLRLAFISNTGETIRFVVPRADMEMSALQAQASMNGLITCGIVLTGKGQPVQAQSALRVSTVTRDLELS